MMLEENREPVEEIDYTSSAYLESITRQMQAIADEIEVNPFKKVATASRGSEQADQEA